MHFTRGMPTAVNVRKHSSHHIQGTSDDQCRKCSKLAIVKWMLSVIHHSPPQWGWKTTLRLKSNYQVRGQHNGFAAQLVHSTAKKMQESRRTLSFTKFKSKDSTWAPMPNICLHRVKKCDRLSTPVYRGILRLKSMCDANGGRNHSKANSSIAPWLAIFSIPMG